MWLFEGSCDWCHQKKDYVNPESSICEKYKPKIKGPLDKHIWQLISPPDRDLGMSFIPCTPNQSLRLLVAD